MRRSRFGKLASAAVAGNGMLAGPSQGSVDWLLSRGLSRDEALRQIKTWLPKPRRLPQVAQLVQLFHVEAEELLEAGLSYEAVKALETRGVV